MNWFRLGAVLAAVAVAACGSDDEDKKSDNGKTDKACDLVAQTGCAEGEVCEQVTGGEPACFAPLSVRGTVFDIADDSPIEGARVVARDANDAVVSGVAVTDAMGAYELVVPAPRAEDGTPIQTSYTLRADAEAYLSFPKPPRVALPVDLSEASGDPLAVANAATDIGLIGLPNAGQLGSVSGEVLSESPGGTLVVAGGATGVADADGDYVVFNVPAGSHEVAGYAVGVNLARVSADVTAGERTEGVDLDVVGDATATVSGSVNIVNASGAGNTSIILVVEDTFDANAIRGEAPKGLRVPGVDGAWSIAGVPDGSYVVLGAFENDGLVRDPDTSIGGTEIQRVTVGGDQMVPNFKITGALAVFSPGADGTEVVSGDITFEWEDDSSEDEYLVEVFDALGNEVWETQGNFDPGGNKPATVAYGGPALTAGMLYQFRATSIKDGVPISRTEDLKGVFLFE